MEIRIRNAKANEADQLTQLAMRSKAYWGYSDEFMEACREELAVTSHKINQHIFHFFVAECNGKIVGYYTVESLNNHTFELEALFVEPEFIGQGVGRKLINHAKQLAISFGAKTLLIQGDPNAKAFYLAAGGVQTGERESASIVGRYLPVFEISLKKHNNHSHDE